jgi:DNA-directed RNA polymerase specialized sigma24 family protein
MKYWQKARNYRKYEREDGTFFHIITVDGEDVEVSAEVYQAYSQADRRERYQAERDAGLVLSLNKLAEDEMQLSYLTDKHIESAEDTAIRSLLKAQLAEALALLSEEEQTLIHSIYFEGMSFRALSGQSGIPVMTLHDRICKIIVKMTKKMQ